MIVKTIIISPRLYHRELRAETYFHENLSTMGVTFNIQIITLIYPRYVSKIIRGNHTILNWWVATPFSSLKLRAELETR